MSLIGKLFTALRGGAHEAGQAVADSQALRILDQELRDAEAALSKSKTELTAVMAKRELNARKAAELQAKVEQLEASAGAALDLGNEELARDVATKLLEVQGALEAEQAIVGQFDRSIDSLRAAIRDSENRVRQFKQQVSVVKATESVQKAQSAVAASHSGQTSSLNTAMESLERIREKQSMRSAQMAAAEQLQREESGADLEARLKAAGIGADGRTVDDVLARLRSQKSGQADA